MAQGPMTIEEGITFLLDRAERFYALDAKYRAENPNCTVLIPSGTSGPQGAADRLLEIATEVDSLVLAKQPQKAASRLRTYGLNVWSAK